MSWDFARIGVHRPSLRFPYLVFSIRSYLPLDFNRVSSLRPSYRHPFGRSFTYSLFRRVSGLGTGSGTRCCCPRGGQRCAWSRKLDPNFCSGWGRTSDLGIRLPRTPPFSCLLRHAGGYSRTILTPNLPGYLYIHIYIIYNIYMHVCMYILYRPIYNIRLVKRRTVRHTVICPQIDQELCNNDKMLIKRS